MHEVKRQHHAGQNKVHQQERLEPLAGQPDRCHEHQRRRADPRSEEQVRDHTDKHPSISQPHQRNSNVLQLRPACCANALLKRLVMPSGFTTNPPTPAGLENSLDIILRLMTSFMASVSSHADASLFEPDAKQAQVYVADVLVVGLQSCSA